MCYYYSEGSLLVWGQVKLMIGAIVHSGQEAVSFPLLPRTGDICLISDFLLLNLLSERFLLWHCNTGYLCCQAKTVLFRFFVIRAAFWEISPAKNTIEYNLRSARFSFWSTLVSAGLTSGLALQYWFLVLKAQCHAGDTKKAARCGAKMKDVLHLVHIYMKKKQFKSS